MFCDFSTKKYYTIMSPLISENAATPYMQCSVTICDLIQSFTLVPAWTENTGICIDLEEILLAPFRQCNFQTCEH